MVETAGASTPVMPAIMAEITRWLGGRFADSADFTAELTAGEKIVLRPRSPSFARVIHRIELMFDDVPGLIQSVKIIESEDSFTTFEFIAPRLNEPVPEKLFEGL
jgi:hypothetical protein